MHWMSMKLADNFQIREHSWPCMFQKDKQDKIIQMLDFFIFIFVQFGGQVFQQTIGIPSL